MNVNTAATALARLEDGLARIAGIPVALERPGKAEHGDYATNVALRLAGAQKRPPLEIAAWLHVSYLAPQKSGRPKPQDLIKGDLVFVGRPEGASETGAASKR